MTTPIETVGFESEQDFFNALLQGKIVFQKGNRTLSIWAMVSHPEHQTYKAVGLRGSWERLQDAPHLTGEELKNALAQKFSWLHSGEWWKNYYPEQGDEYDVYGSQNPHAGRASPD